jgi:hypothetical protein
MAAAKSTSWIIAGILTACLGATSAQATSPAKAFKSSHSSSCPTPSAPSPFGRVNALIPGRHLGINHADRLQVLAGPLALLPDGCLVVGLVSDGGCAFRVLNLATGEDAAYLAGPPDPMAVLSGLPTEPGKGEMKLPAAFASMCPLGETALLIADMPGNLILKLDRATGRVSAFAGSGSRGCQVDPDPLATQLSDPACVRTLPNGSVLIGDFTPRGVLQVDVEGKLQRFTGTGDPGPMPGFGKLEPHAFMVGFLHEPDGSVLFSDTNSGRLLRMRGDGSLAVVLDQSGVHAGLPATKDGYPAPFHPYGLARLDDGSIMMANPSALQILQLTPRGELSVFAGSGSNLPLRIGHPRFNPNNPAGTDQLIPSNLVALSDGTILLGRFQDEQILVICPQDELQARLEALVQRGLMEADAVRTELRYLLHPTPELGTELSCLPIGLERIVSGFLAPSPGEALRIRLAAECLEAQLALRGAPSCSSSSSDTP